MERAPCQYDPGLADASEQIIVTWTSKKSSGDMTHTHQTLSPRRHLRKIYLMTPNRRRRRLDPTAPTRGLNRQPLRLSFFDPCTEASQVLTNSLWVRNFTGFKTFSVTLWIIPEGEEGLSFRETDPRFIFNLNSVSTSFSRDLENWAAFALFRFRDRSLACHLGAINRLGALTTEQAATDIV